MSFTAFFSKATGYPAAFPYQVELAESEDWPDLLNVPTGLGKTAAVSLSWLFKRGWRECDRSAPIDSGTPRRLIWCLPMRVLVEQTHRNICEWLDALSVRGEAGEGKVSVHLLMGGEADLKTWAEHPEEDMILIGTQDMLLSRALMRGYGMSRYQWPVHFALLHNDCLWAFDEVQLMGPGLATSAQLEAFRRDFALSQPSRSLWLSATLNPDWLATVDLKRYQAGFQAHSISEQDRDLAGERLGALKSISQAGVRLGADASNKAGAQAYIDALAELVLAAHDRAAQSLVILNRVDRAQALFKALKAARPEAEDLLVHSRYRPAERRATERSISAGSSVDRIIVATQAIEAGVDISSKVLLTELAPWSSLVQRFGRCNRYGEFNGRGGAQIFWIDIEPDAEPLPYQSDELAVARDILADLTEAGPSALPKTDQPRPLTQVLRKKDLLDLFNTDPDLSGFDVDVSDYIRDQGDPGFSVFWRDAVNPNEPELQEPPHRDELCAVSIRQTKLLKKRAAWHWDSLAGRWEKLRESVRPGMTLLLSAKDGGYQQDVGLELGSKKPVTPLPADAFPERERFDADWRSKTVFPVRLDEHLANVARQAAELCAAVDEREFVAEVTRAGRWHDVGKLHEVFDQSMHACESAPDGFLAKSPCMGRHQRPYFRHELASALAWLAQHDDAGGNNTLINLIAYLIAAHHGKVRMSLRAMPGEQAPEDGQRFARGVWEGDRLPALTFDGERTEEVELILGLMELGEGEQGKSWAARCLGLLETYGPFQLAWLETLVRIADWRASGHEQLANDPAQAQQQEVQRG